MDSNRKPLPRLLRCVIFDLDGTLIDSRADLTAAVDAALVRHGLPPIGLERVTLHVGLGARVLVQRSLADAGGEPGSTDEVLASFLELYWQNHRDTTRLYPGVAEALERLHALGLCLAVVSNKPLELTLSLLEHLGVVRCFTAVLGGDSLPERKPHPLPMLEALRRCGATPAEAAIVGDGEPDMQAAQAAGIFAVGVTYGLRDAETLAALGADVLLGSAGEVADLLSSTCPPAAR
jgi:phosphoglycolate phosphatase